MNYGPVLADGFEPSISCVSDRHSNQTELREFKGFRPRGRTTSRTPYLSVRSAFEAVLTPGQLIFHTGQLPHPPKRPQRDRVRSEPPRLWDLRSGCPDSPCGKLSSRNPWLSPPIRFQRMPSPARLTFQSLPDISPRSRGQRKNEESNPNDNVQLASNECRLQAG